LKILVIDDHEVVRRGVKQILEETFSHVEVGEADTGQKGIAAVRQEPWDLAILDISLPDQSGLELLCKLHSTAPQLPLMVLSLHPRSNMLLCLSGAWPISLNDCIRRAGQSLIKS
jgi:DNA-binding NarL/FixJ family response regulator